MEYASNGKANAGLATGIIGTALGGLNALGGLGMIGNCPANMGNNYVTKDMMELQLALVNQQKENAILSADLSSEKKMVEVYNAANNKINSVRDELSNRIYALSEKMDANSAAQAVINAQYGSQLTLNNSQIAQLFSLTQLKIPNSSVCPGWGGVQVTPVNTGTTIA